MNSLRPTGYSQVWVAIVLEAAFQNALEGTRRQCPGLHPLAYGNVEDEALMAKLRQSFYLVLGEAGDATEIIMQFHTSPNWAQGLEQGTMQ